MFAINQFIKYSFLIFFLFAFCSCSSSSFKEDEKNVTNQPVAPAKDTTIQRSVVIPRIICKADTSLSYALYLPGKYNSSEQFPVIYLFDSHGSGSFPIEKYKGLAEKYGYILAGSNNSKNGMSWEANQPQIRIFMKEVADRLTIDPRRVYTCGFSGGSRVASSGAIFDGGINCVIGMGAGFPSIKDPIQNKFDYIGFAGNEDFNMNELIALDASMDKTQLRHQLILFNGKHEWAPASIAEDAFIWIEFNAMKDGLTGKNDTLIRNYLAKCKDSISMLGKQNKIYNKFLLVKKMNNFLNNLYDVSAYVKATISKDTILLKKIFAAKAVLSKEEITMQQDYMKNFTLKNLQWWSSEIKKLNQQSKSKADADRAAMNKRILSYLSLAAYMNASSAIESRQYGLAENYLAIYQRVDPENPEHQYLFAKIYAIGKDSAKAEKALRNCFLLGFDDLPRIKSDTVFKNYNWQKMAGEAKEKTKND